MGRPPGGWSDAKSVNVGAIPVFVHAAKHGGSTDRHLHVHAPVLVTVRCGGPRRPGWLPWCCWCSCRHRRQVDSPLDTGRAAVRFNVHDLRLQDQRGSPVCERVDRSPNPKPGGGSMRDRLISAAVPHRASCLSASHADERVEPSSLGDGFTDQGRQACDQQECPVPQQLQCVFPTDSRPQPDTPASNPRSLVAPRRGSRRHGTRILVVKLSCQLDSPTS